MDIGKEKEVVTIEPVEDPVPAAPEAEPTPEKAPTEPTKTPEPEPDKVS